MMLQWACTTAQRLLKVTFHLFSWIGCNFLWTAHANALQVFIIICRSESTKKPVNIYTLIQLNSLKSDVKLWFDSLLFAWRSYRRGCESKITTIENDIVNPDVVSTQMANPPMCICACSAMIETCFSNFWCLGVCSQCVYYANDGKWNCWTCDVIHCVQFNCEFHCTTAQWDRDHSFTFRWQWDFICEMKMIENERTNVPAQNTRTGIRLFCNASCNNKFIFDWIQRLRAFCQSEIFTHIRWCTIGKQMKVVTSCSIHVSLIRHSSASDTDTHVQVEFRVFVLSTHGMEFELNICPRNACDQFSFVRLECPKWFPLFSLYVRWNNMNDVQFTWQIAETCLHSASNFAKNIFASPKKRNMWNNRTNKTVAVNALPVSHSLHLFRLFSTRNFCFTTICLHRNSERMNLRQTESGKRRKLALPRHAF